MPKSVSKEVVDDSEEEKPKRSSRKSNKQDSPMDVDELSNNGDKKDGETNEGKDEEENEEEEEEEEFEIESIKSAKRGVFDEGKMGYLVRWKGYGQEHDSWVTESDAENAQDLIDEYWAKKGKGSRDKVEGKGTKSKQGRPRKSDTDDAIVVESVSSPVQRRKRGRGTTASTRKGAPKTSEDEAEGDVNDEAEEEPEEEEEEPPKPAKKSRTSSSKTPAKKTKKENGIEKSSQVENMDGEENLPVAEYRPADNELFSKESWERLVKHVDTIEQLDGHLKVFFTLNNGDRVFAENKQCKERFPQKMLTFYESNLRWREVDS